MKKLFLFVIACVSHAQQPDWVNNLKNLPVIDVRSAPYKAKCNGTTDDSAAFQSAFNAANSMGGAMIVLPSKTCYIATKAIATRFVSMHGTGYGSIIKCATGACLVRGDTITNGAFTHESSEWSNFHLIGPGYNTNTAGILVGGDPNGVWSNANLQGHDLTFRQIFIEGFGYGIFNGQNAYTNTYRNLDFRSNGYHYYVGNSVNCCSNERFYDGRMIGATIAAIANIAYAQIYGSGMTIEYNRRGFYEPNATGGGLFECHSCQFETFTDNVSDPECVDIFTGQVNCGLFVDVNTGSPFIMNLFGGNMYFHTTNSMYKATDFMFTSGSQVSISINSTSFGGALTPPIANAVIDAEAFADVANSSVFFVLPHYPSYGVTVAPVYTTTLFNQITIVDATGKWCFGCLLSSGDQVTINKNLAFKTNGSHINTNVSNKDISGACQLSGGTCTITFTTAYTVAPACVANDVNAAAPVRAQVTNTQLILTVGTGGGMGDFVSYTCIGNPN